MKSAEIPVSRTKIIVPALRPEILHRRRLLERFDDLLEKKLFLVTAPAGYGKTSLLVDFARQSEMPVCWLSLDKLDREPQRFLACLIAALAQKFPAFGKQSNAALRSLTNLKQDRERLLSVIINEIYERTDRHFVLIVDDYQFVDTVPFIRDIFSRFVFLVGENCHVVLASRRLPTLPDIALLVARQQVGGFDLEQLAFRPEEIRLLFEHNYGLSLDDRVVAELMHQTEGWITGLHLSASGTVRGMTEPSLTPLQANLTQASRLTGVELTDYLDQQVLAQQPPELRRFLLETSLLEEFDVHLCRQVLGAGEWEKLLKTVRQNNLFVLSIGPGGKWIRYHHLFQEFLQARIHQESPDKAQRILARLAEVCAEGGEWEKAYAIYRQFDDPERLAILVERAGSSMLVSEHFITLQSWLDEMPAALIDRHPALLSLKGVLLCSLGKADAGRPFLDQAILAFREAGDLNSQALAFIRRASVWRAIGDYEGSLQDADRALNILAGKPDQQVLYAEAERVKGVSLKHLGRLTEAIRIQESALRHYQLLPDEELSVAKVHMELGMAYRANGDYAAARNAYEQALAIWRGEKGVHSQVTVLNSLGVLCHSLGEYEQAVRAFEAGLESARQSGASWQEALILTSLGDLYTELDEYEPAGQAYDQATRIAQQVDFQFLTNYLGLAQAGLARLKGNVRKARAYLEKAEPSVQAGGSNHECGLLRMECGCLELLTGNPAAASIQLEQSLEFFAGGGLAAESIWSEVWLAAARSQCREEMAARRHLLSALTAGKAAPLSASLVQALRRARPWLGELEADAKTGPLLAPWLERLSQAERRLPDLRRHLRRLLISVPLGAPRLTIQAFGRARVRVNGRPVTSAQWKTASVRELFFFILSSSRPRTRDEIADTLWPEGDAGQVKLRFKNDLYRLRHALGQDVILFDDNLYQFNRLLDYEYDVEGFTSRLEKAKAAVEAKDKIANLRAAADLREGPYLQDVDSTWVLPERERLDRACTEALKQLAEIHCNNGDKQAALHACQEALQIDACREDIHRLAMQLHADLGDRLAVIWQYQACRDALQSTLEVLPSEETQALYRKLTA